MKKINFDPAEEIPIVRVVIKGPRKSRTANLVFDTGAGFTQVHTAFMEELGYSISDAKEIIRVGGPAGDSQEGYLIEARSLSLFGLTFRQVAIGVYDFNSMTAYQIDGLLGFDVIKKLHLEMNGPEGILRIL